MHLRTTFSLILVTLLVSVSAVISAQRAIYKKPDAATMLATQVFLDRAGFSSGAIDGREGRNTSNAVAAFERARKMTVVEAALAESAEPATISYTITAGDATMPLTSDIPQDMMAKAALPHLGYTSIAEMLSERFHTTPETLKSLNPTATFVAGEQLTVPNVRMGSTAEATPVPDIVVRVSKSMSALTVTDAKGGVLMYAPVTSGSVHDPLPIGRWTVTSVVRDPTFHYNPDLFWDAEPRHAKATITDGPNNPVGVVWIDISKPHYGMHGTPDPQTIGHTESHGCVRLTNWDALRLAALVGKGTKVEFTP